MASTKWHQCLMKILIFCTLLFYFNWKYKHWNYDHAEYNKCLLNALSALNSKVDESPDVSLSEGAESTEQSSRPEEPKKLWYHTKKTHFIHSSIELQKLSEKKKYREHGIFSTENIPFGTILSIEDPLIEVSNGETPGPIKGDDLSIFKEITGSRMERFAFYLRPLQHQRSENNAIYSIISRVGYGLPQNAMMVFGGKQHQHKALLITTRAIEKGEEILTDYLMEWNTPKMTEEQLAIRRQLIRYLDWNPEPELADAIKRLNHDSLSLLQKRKIVTMMHPNGLLGKRPDQSARIYKGCNTLNAKDCHKKTLLELSIRHGTIFKICQSTGAASHGCDHVNDNLYLPKSIEKVNLNHFYHDPATVYNLRLTTHPTKTKFMHSALEFKYFGDEKQFGIIVNKDVPFGTVLAVEYPMVFDKERDWVSYKQKVEKISHSDEHLRRIWNNEFKPSIIQFGNAIYTRLQIPQQVGRSTLPITLTLAKLSTYSTRVKLVDTPKAIYSILSRINFGFPQNIATIFGGPRDGFVCVLIATRDLKKDEELQTNYALNLEDTEIQDYLIEAMNMHELGTLPTDTMQLERDFGADWEMITEIARELRSEKKLKESKRKIKFDELYSNGIIGNTLKNEYSTTKWMLDGCDGMTQKDCNTKEIIKKDIGKRRNDNVLLRMIRGEAPGVSRRIGMTWTGREFVEKSALWHMVYLSKGTRFEQSVNEYVQKGRIRHIKI